MRMEPRISRNSCRTVSKHKSRAELLKHWDVAPAHAPQKPSSNIMGRSAKANEESFKDLNLPQLPVALKYVPASSSRTPPMLILTTNASLVGLLSSKRPTTVKPIPPTLYPTLTSIAIIQTFLPLRRSRAFMSLPRAPPYTSSTQKPKLSTAHSMTPSTLVVSPPTCRPTCTSRPWSPGTSAIQARMMWLNGVCKERPH